MRRYNRGLVRVSCYVHWFAWILVGVAAAQPPASAPRYVPRTLALGSRGALANGQLAAGLALVSPSAVAVGPDGEIYLADEYYMQLVRLRGAGIDIVAGNGEEGFSGDGGPATEARFRGFGPMVVAGREVFVCDTGNFRIRRISGDGIVETVAGNGESRSSGDGGPATAAGIGIPSGLARDAAGTLYFSDSLNNRIRRISREGIIETIAGTGESGFSGDGGPAIAAGLSGPTGIAVDSAGNVYFSDTRNHRLRKITRDGQIETVAGTGAAGQAPDTVRAAGAALAFPGPVATFDNGVVFVAEMLSGVVRRIDPSGTMTRVAGGGTLMTDTGSALAVRFYSADALAPLAGGRLAMVDRAGKRVRSLDLAQATVGVVAGGGVLPGREGSILGVSGLAVDPEGAVFVADRLDHRIKRVSGSSTVTVFAGTGAPGTAGDGAAAANSQIQEPTGLTTDREGDLFLTSLGGSRIRRIARGGGAITGIGGSTDGFSGDGGPATAARFGMPGGVAMGPGGVVLVADTANNRIRRIRADGVVTTLAGTGEPGFDGDGGPASRARFNAPVGVAVDGVGAIYVADTLNHRVRRIDPDGTVSTVAGSGTAGASGNGVPAEQAQLGAPKWIAIDAGGNLFVGNSWAGGAAVVTPDGILHRLGGEQEGIGSIEGIAVSDAGEVSFWDRTNRRLWQLDPVPLNDDAVVNLASQRTGPIAPGLMLMIRGIGLGPAEGVVTSAGDDGRVPIRAGGTAVLLDGVPIPILAAQYARVLAIAPYGIANRGSVEISVDYNGRRTNPVRVEVRPASPALFTRDGRGAGLAVARNSDGSDNFAGNPTFRGDIVTLVATGLGETDPVTEAGRVYADEGIAPAGRIRVSFGEVEGELLDVSVPFNQLSSVFEVVVRVPGGAPAGSAVPVSVRVGDFSSPPGPVIAIE